MAHRQHHRPYLFVFATLLAISTNQSVAAGFALIEQSVSGLGNAYAGAAASAEDAATVFFNPAGLMYLEGNQLVVGGHIVKPSAEFSGSATNVLGAPVSGGDGGDAGNTPSELEKERPYIESNIAMTRRAYALERSEEVAFPAEDAVTAAEVQASPFTHGGYDEMHFVDYAAVKYKEARKNADWVLWVDIDEFLYTPKPLREALDHYRMREILAVQCDGYQMAAYRFPYGADSLTDAVRVGAYDKFYNKMTCFDPTLDVRWSVGRHSCAIDGLCPTPTGMKLLHYRYFGDEWLRQRNARNYARRSAEDIEMRRGYQTAPDYDGGRYSPAWYKAILEDGKEVI